MVTAGIAANMSPLRGRSDGRARDGRAHPLALAFFALFAGLVGLALAIAFLGDASDGDPVVVLDLFAPPAETAGAMPAMPGLAPRAPESGPAATDLAPGEGAPAVPETPAAPAIAEARYADGTLVADPALIESSPIGPLPIVAADGRRPMDAYAKPFDNVDARPRIAIVIGGLGISARATELAIETLPPEVTLAFAPYAGDVQNWVDKARAKGHEVMVEVPMEPYDFPDSDPGPHTLLAAASSEENMKRLIWSLTRFTGYVGATNLLGGRFLGEASPLEPVLAQFKRRGLLFFDNGASPRSVAADTAQRMGAPLATGALIIDTVQTKAGVDAKLMDLEARAREMGRTTGSGFLYPVTLERVAEWAASLSSRGFVLAPISAIVRAPRSETPETAAGVPG